MSVQSFYENESWIGKWLLVVAVAALVITQNIAWREISGGGITYRLELCSHAMVLPIIYERQIR